MSAFLMLAVAAAGVFGALSATWLLQLRTRNAGEVDAVWSWCVGGLGVWYAVAGTAPDALRLLLAAMAGTWGLRLGLHLFFRNHGKPEDGRYARLRASWGAAADRRMLIFFWIQGAFAMALSVGFYFVSRRDGLPPLPLIASSAAIWLASVAGEGLADRQLQGFRSDPANKGKVCRVGLWKFSRHPNYFFESVHWLAYPLLLVGDTGWLGLAASLLPAGVMALLLLKVSGLPMTEAQAAASRPDYADYMRTTSAFIPWPPKRAR